MAKPTDISAKNRRNSLKLHALNFRVLPVKHSNMSTKYHTEHIYIRLDVQRAAANQLSSDEYISRKYFEKKKYALDLLFQVRKSMSRLSEIEAVKHLRRLLRPIYDISFFLALQHAFEFDRSLQSIWKRRLRP